MRNLQIFGNLQMSEQFSEVRKYTKTATILFICLTSLVIFKFKNSKQNLFQSSSSNATSLEKFSHNFTTSMIHGYVNNASKPNNTNTNPINNRHDIFEELLSSGFDKNSCLSRYERSTYRKNQPYKPSPHLISKLRSYQTLHARCGPHSPSYRQSISKLSTNFSDTIPCKYLIWTPANGLGNRIVSITSAFLYALLESRVLLVEFETEMDDLFCDPFPNSTWVLPNDFPGKHHWAELPSFETVLNSGDAQFSPPIVHLNLQHGTGDPIIRHFHCNSSQFLAHVIPVLILRSDQYFTPSLFLIPSLIEELNKMFPQKGSVFHLLGNYLFNPSNDAWGLITRFYDAYLSKTDTKIGLQIRAFPPPDKKPPYDKIMSQILNCTLTNQILPSFATKKSVAKNQISKSSAVLVSSLYPQFSEQLRNMYWTKPTSTGDVIGVYQPSHEEYQKFGDNVHNMKAWAEIYLLSLCDVLVTSGQSTFGYVAHGLAGLNPWVLNKLDGSKARYPTCKRGISSEPCFHIAPKDDCHGHKTDNITTLKYYLRECEDLWWGIKLVND
ncbi:hypothetical protein RND81_13G039900 [Saponaria officinalis]|uniref:Fucosyltransferase n=1 Tax=Saponaria officinalis TaxID=3572 RepID=A0AAW1GVV7_SAPOF